MVISFITVPLKTDEGRSCFYFFMWLYHLRLTSAVCILRPHAWSPPEIKYETNAKLFVCNDVILGFQLTGRYDKNYFNVLIEFRDGLRLKR